MLPATNTPEMSVLASSARRSVRPGSERIKSIDPLRQTQHTKEMRVKLLYVEPSCAYIGSLQLTFLCHRIQDVGNVSFKLAKRLVLVAFWWHRGCRNVLLALAEIVFFFAYSGAG
jgi:hypothetical protein